RGPGLGPRVAAGYVTRGLAAALGAPGGSHRAISRSGGFCSLAVPPALAEHGLVAAGTLVFRERNGNGGMKNGPLVFGRFLEPRSHFAFSISSFFYCKFLILY
nr:hypothetical protein [Tanacetum cinerariifolium]